jgi:formylglycine-generating enzyme required for sulfatase activity
MDKGQFLQLPVDETDSINLVWCPPGEFMMGYPDNDLLSTRHDEHFQQRVRLTQGFWLGTTQITQSHWKKIVGKNPRLVTGGPGSSWFPAEGMGWPEAINFCQLLTGFWKDSGIIKDGQKVSLPSEAQWEYACRAGTTTHWYFGDGEAELGHHAWYVKNSDNHTHPVGLKQANPWGLFDLYGNVMEWCLDDFYLYKENNEVLINPIYQKETGMVIKMVRGGSYIHPANEIGSASRETVNLENPFNEPTGLRIVLATL